MARFFPEADDETWHEERTLARAQRRRVAGVIRGVASNVNVPGNRGDGWKLAKCRFTATVSSEGRVYLFVENKGRATGPRLFVTLAGGCVPLLASGTFIARPRVADWKLLGRVGDTGNEEESRSVNAGLLSEGQFLWSKRG